MIVCALGENIPGISFVTVGDTFVHVISQAVTQVGHLEQRGQCGERFSVSVAIAIEVLVQGEAEINQ